MSKGWDNATLKKLKALSAKGLSTAEIGKKLGISKNAVVGKLNRLGWNSKAGGIPVLEDESPKKAVKKAKPVQKPAPVVAKKVSSSSKKAPVVKKPEPKKIVKAPVKKVAVAPVKKAPVKKPVKEVVKAAPVKAVAAKPVVVEKKTESSKKNVSIHQRIIQHSLEMANLKPDQCRWPLGDPDSENFHFCGEKVFAGKPYCYKHCKEAYQFTPVKKK